MTVSPMPGPRTASSSADAVAHGPADTQCSTLRPASARTGPIEMRPWLGLSPTRPHADAGMRMLPPPSDALAIGTMPAATAAAAPPLEPPGVRSRSHGLCVGPHAAGWVHGRLPISGLFVRPAMTNPAALYARHQRRVGRVDDRRLLEGDVAVGEGLAGEARVEVLEQERHAAERAVGQVGRRRRSARASSNQVIVRAWTAGSIASIRSIAASSSSLGVTSPLATSAAWSTASIQRVSSASGLMPPSVARPATVAAGAATDRDRPRPDRSGADQGPGRSPRSCSPPPRRRSPRRCRRRRSASRSSTSPTARWPSACSACSSSCRR